MILFLYFNYEAVNIASAGYDVCFLQFYSSHSVGDTF